MLFISCWELFFGLKIFDLLFRIFGHVGKRLDETTKVNFKIQDVTGWEKIITLQILPNISGTKGNKVTEIGELIEYNVRSIFIQKSCRKWGRETSNRPLFGFKKALWQEQVVNTLVLTCFGRPRLGHTIKTFQTGNLEVCSILIFFFINGSRTSFSTIFFM